MESVCCEEQREREEVREGNEGAKGKKQWIFIFFSKVEFSIKCSIPLLFFLTCAMLIAWARSVGWLSAYVWKRLARGLEMVFSESVNSLKTKAAIVDGFSERRRRRRRGAVCELEELALFFFPPFSQFALRNEKRNEELAAKNEHLFDPSLKR